MLKTLKLSVAKAIEGKNTESKIRNQKNYYNWKFQR